MKIKGFRSLEFRIALIAILGGAVLSACGGSSGGGPDTEPSGPVSPSVDIADATAVNAVITNLSIASPPVVEFLLSTDDGNPVSNLPASSVSFVLAKLVPGTDGQSSYWQSYINRIEEPGVGPGTSAELQAATENGALGELVESPAGTYIYRFALDIGDVTAPAPITYVPTLTHRVSFEIRGYVPVRNPVYDLRPADNAVSGLFSREIAAMENCNACHGNLALHGNGRFELQNCVTCHNPGSIDANSGNTLDMTVMTHKIHMGEDLPSVMAGDDYCIYGRNDVQYCYGDVVYTGDLENCSGCHSVDDMATPQAARWFEWPTAEACGSCHDDVDFVTGENHGEAGPADNSQCITCHAANPNSPLEVRNAHQSVLVEGAAAYRFNILAIDFLTPGTAPLVTFSVTNPQDQDLPYDLANDPDLIRSRLRLGVAWDTVDYSNVGTSAGNSQSQLTDIYSNGALLAQDNGDYSYSLTIATVAGAATGTGVVTFEGAVQSDLGRLPVTSAHKYFSITDDPLNPTPRRTSTDITLCNDCHVPLSYHGGTRNDSLEVCQTCHLADASRQSNLGPMDMKVFVHRIHAVDEIRYPQPIGNCLACHTDDGFFPISSGSGVLASSFTQGPDQTDPTDNNRISPNTATCGVCHSSADAVSHMVGRGGSYDTCQEPDGSLRERVDFCGPGGNKSGAAISESSCAACHGPGGLSDVADVHSLL